MKMSSWLFIYSRNLDEYYCPPRCYLLRMDLQVNNAMSSHRFLFIIVDRSKIMILITKPFVDVIRNGISEMCIEKCS